MIRKLLLAVAVLVGLNAYAVTAPVTSTDQTITPNSTACFTANIFTTDATGNTYKCVGSPLKWQRKDLPDCPANPPSGACPGGVNGNAICKTTNAATIYGCDGSGNWAAMSGSGAAPAGTTNDVQVNNAGALMASTGFTATAAGVVATKILNGVHNVKGYGAIGDGTTNDYTAINTALAAVSSAGGILHFPSTSGGYKISTNLTIPYNVGLKLDPGAILKPDGGVTVRIQGPIDAGSYQIFGGSGAIALAPSTSTEVLYGPVSIAEAPIQWWGCFPNTTADCGATITTALAAVAPGTFLTFHGGTFRIATGVTSTKRYFNMRGETGGYRPGTGYPTFIWDGADAGVMFTITDADGIRVEEVAFDGDFSAATAVKLASTDSGAPVGQPKSGWQMLFQRVGFTACRGVCLDIGGTDATYDEDYSQLLFDQCWFNRPSGRTSDADGNSLTLSGIAAGNHLRIRAWNSYNVTFRNTHFFSTATSSDADQDARCGIVAEGGYLRFEGGLFVNRGIDICINNPSPGSLPSQIEVYGGESQSAQFIKTFAGAGYTSMRNSVITGFRHTPSISGYTPGAGMVNSIYWDGPTNNNQSRLTLVGNVFRKNVEIGTATVLVSSIENVFAAGFNFTGNTAAVVGNLGARGTVRPTNPAIGESYVVTDDSSAGACDSAGGVARTLCRWNGTAWESIGDGSGVPQMLTDHLLGRDTAGTGNAEQIAVDGTIIFNGSFGIGRAALFGDIACPAGSNSCGLSSGVIIDGDVSPGAAISDTKLNTISTPGKVANAATTATSLGTVSAIVARDANGDFTARDATLRSVISDGTTADLSRRAAFGENSGNVVDALPAGFNFMFSKGAAGSGLPYWQNTGGVVAMHHDGQTGATVATPAASDRTTKIATTAFVGTLAGVGAVSTANVNAVAATDVNVAELALPAGYLNRSNAVSMFNAAGSWTSGTVSTPTMTFKVKLCTVSGCGSGTVLTLVSVTSAAATAGTTQQFRLDGSIGTTATGATGTVLAHVVADLPVGSTNNTAFAGFHDVNTAASAAIDLTAALFLELVWNASAMAGTTHTAAANVFALGSRN